MDTIFMNSKSSKTSVPHKLLTITQSYRKINLKRSDEYVVLTNLNKYYT